MTKLHSVIYFDDIGILKSCLTIRANLLEISIFCGLCIIIVGLLHRYCIVICAAFTGSGRPQLPSMH